MQEIQQNLKYFALEDCPTFGTGPCLPEPQKYSTTHVRQKGLERPMSGNLLLSFTSPGHFASFITETILPCHPLHNHLQCDQL